MAVNFRALDFKWGQVSGSRWMGRILGREKELVVWVDPWGDPSLDRWMWNSRIMVGSRMEFGHGGWSTGRAAARAGAESCVIARLEVPVGR